MSGNRRIFLLIVIMTMMALGIAGSTLYVLFRAALDQQRNRLTETAQSEARLLEAIARFDAQHYGATHTPEETVEATLSQMRDAHERFEGFGDTGEFVLARQEGDQIVFLLRHRHDDTENPEPIPLADTSRADPMRRALAGESGTMIGQDYRGVTVLAAYEPVAELDLGIVAKIDMAEVRKPFIRAGLSAGGIGLLLVTLGTLLFVRVSSPLIRALEESEARYRAVFEQAADSVILVDANTGSLLEFNDCAFEKLGYSRDEFSRLQLADVEAIETPNDVAAHVQQVTREGTDSFETKHRTKDGRIRDVQVDTRAINIGGKQYVLSVWHDITERKQNEAKLQAYSTRLEEMVNQRTQALRDAQEQLIRQEKLALLGQLAGGVGHELRNPLGVISNAVYYLQMTLADADDMTRQYLSIIESEIHNSTRIVTGLLDISRTKTGSREVVAVDDVLERALEKQPAPAGVTVTPEIPDDLPEVEVDVLQIVQVMGNLLANAYQAMPDGGQLTVGASVAGVQVRVSFADTGVGIPAGHQQKIFEPLFTTRSRGIGLGLAVSKNYVEMNGGSITVESTEGAGSTFTISLPIGDLADRQPEPDESTLADEV